MKRSSLFIILTFVCVAVLALTRWYVDGKQLWTKQEMVVEIIEKDDIFGTEVRKNTIVPGFWLGLDIAGTTSIIAILAIVVTLRANRKR